MSLPERFVVVLHQVQSPENLGGVARAMANFGGRTLIVSDPQLPEGETLEGSAGRTAVKSAFLLEEAKVVSTLEEALGDVSYACGTSFRQQLDDGRRALSPERAAERLSAEAANGPVALVFGGERRGLSDRELSACEDFLTIPTSTEQPSMNLAQSASLLLYLCARAASDRSSWPPPPEPGAPARLRLLWTLEQTMERALTAADYLNPQAPTYVLRELVRTLIRARPTEREAGLWTNAFKHMERAVAKGAGKP